MGNWWSTEPPPQMVLVPPIFDFPPLAARTRMLESPYNLMFGKMALRCLFEDFFDEPRHFSSRIMLKPNDDPNVDLIATVSGPLEHIPAEKFVGNAQFRWQRDVDDPHTFIDISVSNMNPALLMRSCYYFPKYGVGAFGIFPAFMKERVSNEDFDIVGLRYGSSNLSLGTAFSALSARNLLPNNVWLLSNVGKLTAGIQYGAQSEELSQYINMNNWSCAISYGSGSSSPLSPSFNFALELARNSQFIASFYQHVVVQRRVKNPLEEKEIVGITNYLDFGFELQTRIDNNISSKNLNDSSFQVGASWQANKNFLLKGKVGPLGSSIALAFKSWWNPSFTVSMSAIRDRTKAETSFGFGLSVDNVRKASYERADPNLVMLTPNKGHLAEGTHWEFGNAHILQSHTNLDTLPKELYPLGNNIL